MASASISGTTLLNQFIDVCVNVNAIDAMPKKEATTLRASDFLWIHGVN